MQLRMSEQIAEQLENKFEGVSLPALKMFGLIRQLPSPNETWNECLEWFEYDIPPKPYTVPPPADGAKMMWASCLTRGFIGHHVLNSNGSLTLIKYEFLSFDSSPPCFQSVNLEIKGDFWMILREYSCARLTMYIPFFDGKIVPDSTEWITRTE